MPSAFAFYDRDLPNEILLTRGNLAARSNDSIGITKAYTIPATCHHSSETGDIEELRCFRLLGRVLPSFGLKDSVGNEITVWKEAGSRL